MLHFIDYIYFRCYSYYLKKDKEGVPSFWSSSIIAVVLFFNILFVIYLFGFISQGVHFKVDKYNSVIGILALWLIAFIRYKGFVDFNTLQEKWGNETQSDKVRKGRNIVIYIVTSFALVLGGLQFVKLILR